MRLREVTFVAVAALFVAGCGGHEGDSVPASSAPRSPEGRPLRVVVRAVRYDMPVAGARVKRHDDAVELGRTDEAGATTILVDDPETVIDVEAPSFATLVVASSYFSRASDGSLHVSLEDGVPVRGRVLDAASLAPIEGARIEARCGLWRFGRFGTATSDREGRFEITGVPPRLPRSSPGIIEPKIECRVAAAGHVVGRRDLSAADGNDVVDAGDVLLEPAATVRVRVVRADGRPADGARVRVGDGDFEPTDPKWIKFPFADPPKEWFVDASGEAVLDGMSHEARIRLSASTDDCAEMDEFTGVAVSRGAREARADIRLSPRGRLVVHVLNADDAEIPTAETRVWVEATDSSFVNRAVDGDPRVVRGLRPGKWRIHAERKHGASAETVVDVAVGANEAAVRLGGRATLTGRVVDDRGAPRQFVSVELYADGGQSQAAAIVDESGAFNIERLVYGEYQLVARSQDGEVARLDVTVPARDVAVVVERACVAVGRLRVPDGLEIPTTAYVKDVTGDSKSRHAENRRCEVAAGVLHATTSRQGRRILSIQCEGFEDARVTVDLVAGEKRSFGVVVLTVR